MSSAEDAERLDRAVAELRRSSPDVGHLLETQLAIPADARRDACFIGCGKHPDQPTHDVIVWIGPARFRNMGLDPTDHPRPEGAILSQQGARRLEERLTRLGLADGA